MLLKRIDRTTAAATRGGFTLMELLVVVAILLVLVAVATPLYLGYLERSKLKTAKATAMMLAEELDRYAVDHIGDPNGQWPPPGTWDGVELRRPAIDPWGQPYQWDLDPTTGRPIVWSLGPRGNLGPLDELSSAY
jgi:general secretion pathway protein G